MALYRVLERCLLNPGNSHESRIYEPGETIDYLGVAEEYLEPLDSAPSMARRRFGVGRFGLSDDLHRHKRAEIFATAGRVVGQKN